MLSNFSKLSDNLLNVLTILQRFVIIYQTSHTGKTQRRERLKLTIKTKYLNHLADKKGMKRCFNSVLIELLNRAEGTKAGLSFSVNKEIKEDIAKRLDTSLSTVNNAISNFCKSGYLHRLERGKYIFDASLFGLRSWRDIDNIVAVYNYGTDDINAVFQYADES